MHVHPSVSEITATVKNIPPKQLVELVVGQRLEIEVSKAVSAGEIVIANIAGKLIELRTPVALQAGQIVPVELAIEEGKLVLKLISSSENPKIPGRINLAAQTEKLSGFSLENLKQGQQLAVEVVKLLANKRLLVQLVVNEPSPTNQTKISPQQFDVDVSKLTRPHQVGEKLKMNIISVKPLNIQLEPVVIASREQRILENIRQLLPHQPATPQLKVISSLIQQQSLPDNVRQAIDTLVQHSTDKAQLTDAGKLKQSVLSSGVVMENILLNQPNIKTQDFKANLAKVMVAVEASLLQMKNAAAKPELNKLPSQVESALTVNGKTPAQLLNVLLSNNYRIPLLSANSPAFLSTITSPSHALSIVQLLTKPFTLAPQSLMATIEKVVARPELLQLLKEVEGVHQKIQMNQLIMLKEPETTSNTASSWLFDVPVKDKHNLDIVQMQIDQQKNAKDDKEDNDIWNVKLRLDTENLGPVQASVTLHQSDVKVVIKAEIEESAQLLTEYLSELELAMAKLELTMSYLSCSCGEVEQAIMTSSDLPKDISSGLVDISV
ncbi:flagellar hook-length control protein FliK [Pseudomonadota bacterium]|nr:flagellar hook-length control protein FliK [Pseudomonadota bacterium]